MHPLPSRYSITFEGKYFWDTKNGYGAELASFQQAENDERAYDYRAEMNQIRLNWLTGVLSLVALAVGWLVVIDFLERHKFYSWYAFYFFAGAILGIGLYHILRILIRK